MANPIWYGKNVVTMKTYVRHMIFYHGMSKQLVDIAYTEDSF